MKINKVLLFCFFFYTFLCILLTYYAFIISPKFLSEIVKDGSTSMEYLTKIFAIVVDVLILLLLTFEFIKGDKYVEVIQVPLTDLEIKEYKNLRVVVYRDMAFPIRNYYTSWMKKETVKVTKYYNRKKVESSWNINLPYMRGY